jgi:hypothetical protein
VWSFLKLLCESDRLFYVKQPFLGSLFVFACVNFFIGLLDGEIEELFLHVKSHVLLLDYFQTVETAQGSDLFWFFGEIAYVFISYHRPLERIYQQISFFQVHERSFRFHYNSSDDSGQRKW